MRKKLVWSVGTVSAIVLAIAVSACGSSGSNSSSGSSKVAGISVKPKSIGVLDESGAAPADAAMAQMVKLAAQKLGWKFTYIDSGGDPAKLTSGAQTLAAQKVDAFVGDSVEASQVLAPLKQMTAAGVQSCEVGGGAAPNSDYTAQYGEQERQLGVTLAKQLLADHPKAQAIVLANPQNFAGVERQKGFTATIQAGGGKVLTAPVVDFADPVGSATKGATDGLTKYPNADAIYAVFDFSTAPAIAAIKKAGAKARVYAHYTETGTVPEMRKGPGKSIVAAVADVNLIKGAAICVDQLLQHFEKGKPMDPNAVQASGGYIYNTVTPENVNKLVPASGVTQYDANKIIDQYIAKWEKEYPAK
jgi:ABC-type sugar transport system substrate-binding protein